MYLFFNEEGRVDLIYPEVKPAAEMLEGDNWIEYEGKIPEKKGYETVVYVKDDKVSFEYEELPKSEIEEDLALLSDMVAELTFMMMEG